MGKAFGHSVPFPALMSVATYFRQTTARNRICRSTVARAHGDRSSPVAREEESVATRSRPTSNDSTDSASSGDDDRGGRARTGAGRFSRRGLSNSARRARTEARRRLSALRSLFFQVMLESTFARCRSPPFFDECIMPWTETG